MPGITRTEFIGRLKVGEKYTGYVEGIGDIHWVGEPVYFAKVYKMYSSPIGGNPMFIENDYASPKAAENDYKRRGGDKPIGTRFVWKELNSISIWQYRSGRFEIKTKTRYRIVITPNPMKDLSYNNNQSQHIAVNDAIPKHNYDIEKHSAYIENELNFLGRGEKEFADGMNRIESIMEESGVSAALDVLGEFNATPKSVGNFTNFLAGISIINDLDDGEYESAGIKTFVLAAGKGLGKIGLGWMSTAYSVGSFMYNTDHMQSGVSNGLWREYWCWQIRAERGYGGTIFGNAEEMARRKRETAKEFDRARKARKK